MPIYAVFSRQWAERTGRKLVWSLIITTCRCEFLDASWVNTIFDAGLELSRKLLPD
jgi:hypothetical protein